MIYKVQVMTTEEVERYKKQRADEVNRQIFKDAIDGRITYPFASSDKNASEALAAVNSGEELSAVTTNTVLIPLAVMQSQVSTNDYVKESYGGVGIDSINSNLVNSSGINRRMNVSLTFTNPNIIEVNYAYQKLLTLNTKYIIALHIKRACVLNVIIISHIKLLII